MAKINSSVIWLGLGAGIGAALTALKIGQAVLRGDQVKRLLHPPRGQQFAETHQGEAYTITHTITDGIERITYTPAKRRFETPILMQHGMWHGAWCWQPWQELLAEWGWESTAISLPGHGQSPEQRAITLCTLEYYLSFIKAEVERMPRKPVLMGHSMGGALTQWYLKYVGDDLPAAVMVAPWNAFDVLRDSMPSFLRLDALAVVETILDMSANRLVNTPQRAASALLSPGSAISPAALQAKLGPESALILFEHRPPHWTPPANLKTPTLLLAGDADAVVSLDGLRRSAAHFGADFISIPGAGHNLMHAHNSHETAQHIHTWLSTRLS
jgi:pimeloyl-ACP methyl ester carboxylesterase